jgi:polar amino acid transport system substrate-binding protein
MKKIISLVLATALLALSLFAFAGCGKDDNVLVCGVTDIPGLNEQDENGNWIGFESEFAMEVAKLLGMEVEFQIISWGEKYVELNSGKIDCIWNGFTANAKEKDGTDRKDLVDFSSTYMLNQQCVVVKKSELDSYKTKADLKGKTAAIETGSAGETFAKEVVGDEGELVGFTAQNSTFMEVKTGKSDFAVVDILLAKNICGKGDFTDLAIVEAEELTLETEYYAIGFKKGSNLTAKVNEAIKTLNENGKLLEIAKKYGFENCLQVADFNG